MRRTRLRASVLPGTTGPAVVKPFDEPNDAPARPTIQVCNRCGPWDACPFFVRYQLKTRAAFGVTAETVEDDAIRCTFIRQHAEHVVVRVAVMDHERLAGRFRNRDVPTERLLLRLPAVLARSEVIEPRLPHRDNLRMNRK